MISEKIAEGGRTGGKGGYQVNDAAKAGGFLHRAGTGKIRRKLVSQIDGTIKYLYEFSDGETVESVLMQYEHGYSLCISTQVGCRMGCRFCASTLMGLERSLTPAEMLNEVYMAGKDSGQKISSIVLMEYTTVE